MECSASSFAAEPQHLRILGDVAGAVADQGRPAARPTAPGRGLPPRRPRSSRRPRPRSLCSKLADALTAHAETTPVTTARLARNRIQSPRHLPYCNRYPIRGAAAGRGTRVVVGQHDLAAEGRRRLPGQAACRAGPVLVALREGGVSTSAAPGCARDCPAAPRSGARSRGQAASAVGEGGSPDQHVRPVDSAKAASQGGVHDENPTGETMDRPRLDH